MLPACCWRRKTHETELQPPLWGEKKSEVCKFNHRLSVVMSVWAEGLSAGGRMEAGRCLKATCVDLQLISSCIPEADLPLQRNEHRSHETWVYQRYAESLSCTFCFSLVCMFRNYVLPVAASSKLMKGCEEMTKHSNLKHFNLMHWRCSTNPLLFPGFINGKRVFGVPHTLCHRGAFRPNTALPNTQTKQHPLLFSRRLLIHVEVGCDHTAIT